MKKLLFSAIMLFVACTLASAGEPGTEALPFLRISRDPASLSEGAAQISSSAYSVFTNPSVIPFSSKGVQAAVSYGRWTPNSSSMLDAGVSARIGKRIGITGGLSTGINTPYDLYGKTGKVVGKYTPVDMIMGVGVACAIIDYLSVGANIKYAFSSLAKGSSYGAVASDIFVAGQYKGLVATVGVASLGSKVKSESGDAYAIPASAAFGLGYKNMFADKYGVAAQVNGDYYFSGAFSAAAGLELSYADYVSLRAGYNYGGKSVIPSYAHVGLGAGYDFINFNAKVLLGNENLNGTVIVGLSLDF